MKRKAQIHKAGVPSAGTYSKGFCGWRKSSQKWRKGEPLIDTRHRSDLTMIERTRNINLGLVKSGYKFIAHKNESI